MDAKELASLGLDLRKNSPVELNMGKGCMKCRGTGYLGRSGVYEILPVTESIKKMITAESKVEEMREMAKKEGMITLRENAVKKLLQGETTYQEVLRVTWKPI
jgi:general secretion pathway protein E